MIEVGNVPRLVSLSREGKDMKRGMSFRSRVGTQCDRTVSITSHCSSCEFLSNHQRDGDVAGSSGSDAMFASQQDVSRLLHDTQQEMQATQNAQNKLQRSIDKCLSLARGRLAMGSTVTARVALRRMQEERIELGRLAAMQCKLMDIYTLVQDEWKQAQSFSATNTATALVDVDISFYRHELAQIETEVDGMVPIPRTMVELLQELEETVKKEETAPGRF